VIASGNVARWTFDAWLAREQAQPARHEMIDGRLRAQAWPSRAHAAVTLSLGALLHAALRGTALRVVAASLPIRIAEAQAAFYPDLCVSRDPRDLAAERCLEHPILVVEVVSPHSAGFDTGAKFAAYRRLASLAEILFVDPEAQRVDHYARAGTGSWVVVEAPVGEPIRLVSLDLSFPWNEVFADLSPPEPALPSAIGTVPLDVAFAPFEVPPLQRAHGGPAVGVAQVSTPAPSTAVSSEAVRVADMPPWEPPFVREPVRRDSARERVVFPMFSVPPQARPITLPNLRAQEPA